MRIIAGEYGGRKLRQPRDRRVRPTGERVREAWFSIVLLELPGASVLDLFAGSGALGLEALSRGARRADFVEIGRASIAALRANIGALGVEERATVHQGDALHFVGRLAPGSYDIAFADPPYTGDAALELVECFRRSGFARVLTVEHRFQLEVPGDETRRYGDTALTLCYAG